MPAPIKVSPPLPELQKSSFRDPSGFLFTRDGCLYRQVNQRYKSHYDQLIGSGLYDELVAAGLLIPHQEAKSARGLSDDAYKVIQPEPVGFISYPYEWSFSQLKDAALTTLAVQVKALDHGMILKDASAYNIQFHQGRPVLIDTLSFEIYQEGEPWMGYRQFCQHFFVPLALMSCVDIRLNQLLRIYIDGVPLDLAATLLPFKKRFNFSFLTHLFIHARAQTQFADSGEKKRQRAVPKVGLLGIVGNLESAIRRLEWTPEGTEWADYYNDTNYSESGLDAKATVVSEFLAETQPETVWDLGANLGLFSRVAAKVAPRVISCDIDPAAVELNYLRAKKDADTAILPLLIDLTNPSPGIGWSNEERSSLAGRGPADTAMALALIHHIAVSNNVPFPKIAEFFQSLCRHLIIEFVPKSDSQVQRLLATREDIFDSYTQSNFEQDFSQFFRIVRSVPVVESERVMYLMESRALDR